VDAGTNYTAGLGSAFAMLNNGLATSAANSSRVILFLTDGTPQDTTYVLRGWVVVGGGFE
jgi:hypothetical protein